MFNKFNDNVKKGDVKLDENIKNIPTGGELRRSQRLSQKAPATTYWYTGYKFYKKPRDSIKSVPYTKFGSKAAIMKKAFGAANNSQTLLTDFSQTDATYETIATQQLFSPTDILEDQECNNTLSPRVNFAKVSQELSENVLKNSNECQMSSANAAEGLKEKDLTPNKLPLNRSEEMAPKFDSDATYCSEVEEMMRSASTVNVITEDATLTHLNGTNSTSQVFSFKDSGNALTVEEKPFKLVNKCNKTYKRKPKSQPTISCPSKQAKISTLNVGENQNSDVIAEANPKAGRNFLKQSQTKSRNSKYHPYQKVHIEPKSCILLTSLIPSKQTNVDVPLDLSINKSEESFNKTSTFEQNINKSFEASKNSHVSIETSTNLLNTDPVTSSKFAVAIKDELQFRKNGLQNEEYSSLNNCAETKIINSYEAHNVLKHTRITPLELIAQHDESNKTNPEISETTSCRQITKARRGRPRKLKSPNTKKLNSFAFKNEMQNPDGISQLQVSMLPEIYPPHFKHQLPLEAVQTQPLLPTQLANIMTPEHTQSLELTDSLSSSPSLPESLRSVFGTDSLRQVLNIEKMEYRLCDYHVQALAVVLNLSEEYLRGLLDNIVKLNPNTLRKIHKALNSPFAPDRDLFGRTTSTEEESTNSEADAVSKSPSPIANISRMKVPRINKKLME